MSWTLRHCLSSNNPSGFKVADLFVNVDQRPMVSATFEVVVIDLALNSGSL
jgi:hypothetical protein